MAQQNDGFDPFEMVRSDAIQASDVLLKYGIQFWRGVAGMFSAPGDMVMRPWFGSQVINPIRAFVAWVALGIATIIGVMVEPGFQATSGGPRLIGMEEVFAAFNLMLLWHTWRVHRLMMNMDRELDSLDEGPPLFFMKWLPRPTWAKCRLIYEPLLIVVLAFGFHMGGLIEPTVFIYAMLLAKMMFLHALTTWYGSWLTIRENLDSSYRSQVLMEVVKGQRDARALNPAIAGHIPQAASAMTKMRVARAVTGIYPQHPV